MNTLLMFGYCVSKRVLWQVVPRYGSCIAIKITSFCFFRIKFDEGLENGGVEEGDMNNLFRSKKFPNQFRGVE